MRSTGCGGRDGHLSVLTLQFRLTRPNAQQHSCPRGRRWWPSGGGVIGGFLVCGVLALTLLADASRRDRAGRECPLRFPLSLAYRGLSDAILGKCSFPCLPSSVAPRKGVGSPTERGAGDPQSGRSCSESQSLCPPPPVLPASGVVGTVSPPRDPCAVTSWDSQDFQPVSPVGSWLCPRRQPAGHCWLDTGCEARPQSAPMHRGCKVGPSRWPETVRWGAGGEGVLSAGPAPGEGRLRALVCHAWREVSCGPVTRCRALARAPSWG